MNEAKQSRRKREFIANIIGVMFHYLQETKGNYTFITFYLVAFANRVRLEEFLNRPITRN